MWSCFWLPEKTENIHYPVICSNCHRKHTDDILVQTIEHTRNRIAALRLDPIIAFVNLEYVFGEHFPYALMSKIFILGIP